MSLMSEKLRNAQTKCSTSKFLHCFKTYLLVWFGKSKDFQVIVEYISDINLFNRFYLHIWASLNYFI